MGGGGRLGIDQRPQWTGAPPKHSLGRGARRMDRATGSLRGGGNVLAGGPGTKVTVVGPPLALGVDFAPVRLDQVLDDGQAQPGAAFFA